jgi:hypothetical protein
MILLFPLGHYLCANLYREEGEGPIHKHYHWISDVVSIELSLCQEEPEELRCEHIT